MSAATKELNQDEQHELFNRATSLAKRSRKTKVSLRPDLWIELYGTVGFEEVVVRQTSSDIVASRSLSGINISSRVKDHAAAREALEIIRKMAVLDDLASIA